MFDPCTESQLPQPRKYMRPFLTSLGGFLGPIKAHFEGGVAAPFGVGEADLR